MFKNAYVPYKGYWSSPFCVGRNHYRISMLCNWQLPRQKSSLELRKITPDILRWSRLRGDHSQKMWFYDAPWFATLNGQSVDQWSRVAQACATSTVAINVAHLTRGGNNTNMLVATCDRSSNCPKSLAESSGLGGKPDFEAGC